MCSSLFSSQRHSGICRKEKKRKKKEEEKKRYRERMIKIQNKKTGERQASGDKSGKTIM